jgi:hypothetical protein
MLHIEVDARREKVYGNGSYILHYLKDEAGNLKGIFNGAKTANAYRNKYPGQVEAGIRFVADLEAK